MMTKTILVENGLLGGIRVKSLKERAYLMVWRPISTNDSWNVSQGRGLQTLKNRFQMSLFVFWMSHIHWRRLRDKVEKIPTDSEVRTCTEMLRASKSLKKLSKTDTFW